jgi:hypothetical protein
VVGVEEGADEAGAVAEEEVAEAAEEAEGVAPLHKMQGVGSHQMNGPICQRRIRI